MCTHIAQGANTATAANANANANAPGMDLGGEEEAVDDEEHGREEVPAAQHHAGRQRDHVLLVGGVGVRGGGSKARSTPHKTSTRTKRARRRTETTNSVEVAKVAVTEKGALYRWWSLCTRA